MTNFLERSRLVAEQVSLRELIDSLRKDDLLGRASLQKRLEWVEQQLRDASATRGTRAQIALAFDGEPVLGSYGIDAEFSAKVLHSFQSTVSSVFAANAREGFIGERGPTVGAKDSALKVTGVVHGSFGFVLEEVNLAGEQWTDSALLNAASDAVRLVERLSLESLEDAEVMLDSVNPRLLKDLEEFFGAVHSGGATLKISQEDHTAVLDRAAVERAYTRVKDVSVEEREEILRGELLGILPDSRRFEFQAFGNLVKGLATPEVAQSYLAALHSDNLVGRPLNAVFRVKEIKRPSSPTRVVYTLIGLDPLV